MKTIFRRIVLAFVGILTLTVVDFREDALAQSGLPDSLQSLMMNVESTLQITVSKKADSKLVAQLEIMRISEPQKWFIDAFGPENGAELAECYLRDEKADETRIINYFLTDAASGGTVVASIASGGSEPYVTQPLTAVDSAIHKAAKTPLIIYQMQYILSDFRGKTNGGYFLGFIAEIDGAYRRIPFNVLSKLAGMPTMPILRASPALTHKVLPVYPKKAHKAGVSGTVRLHAIIGRDGTVKNLVVVSGDRLLVNSALDAVHKWRYRPMLSEGKLVEVDTTIDVDFILETQLPHP